MTNDVMPVEGGADEQQVTKAMLEAVPDADVQATLLCFEIITTADRLQQDFEVAVHRPSGLSWAAFRNMFALFTLGPMTPQRLSRLNYVSQASTSSILKTLTKHGYVTRRQSPHDGRSVTISLTSTGEQVCVELFRRNNRREVEWAAALTPAERLILIELLNKVRVRPTPDADPTVDRLA
jgi:DNA-binding MarR family transcriptional regulator